MQFSADAIKLAQNVKMVIFDVDGTLTNGCIYTGEQGELMKAFYCRDGMGITLLHRGGIRTAIITGRTSEIVAKRAAELKISAVWQGCADKRVAYAELKERFGLTDEELAYTGDDLNDLPLLYKVALPCAVGDAVPEIKEAAEAVSDFPGGRGAVRELAEFILKAQGKWQAVVSSFTAKPAEGVFAQ